MRPEQTDTGRRAGLDGARARARFAAAIPPAEERRTLAGVEALEQPEVFLDALTRPLAST